MNRTGHSVARAAQLLLEAGEASVEVAVPHALFSDDAMALMQRAGVAEVWSTDCVAHPSNVVSMAGTIAHALTQCQENLS